MKAVWILLPALWLGVTGAEAREIYCDLNGGSLPFGSERTRDWFVVNSTVRKPQLPGQTKPTTGCYVDYYALNGMYRPPEIVVQPKIGKASITASNRLYYTSSKNGDDLVTVRFHYLGRTGNRESALVHYRVHVVDKAL